MTKKYQCEARRHSGGRGFFLRKQGEENLWALGRKFSRLKNKFSRLKNKFSRLGNSMGWPEIATI